MITRSAVLRTISIAAVIGLGIILSAFVDLHGYQKAFELFLAFLVIAWIASLSRGRIRNVAIVLGSVAFGLASVETFAVGTAHTSSPIRSKGFTVSRPVLGWGPARPGSFSAQKRDPETGRVVYDVTYTMDEQLLRKTMSNATGPTVAFFGDSMTFGEGVNDDETMPQAFADLTGRQLHVLNLGFPGFGPQHFLRELETGLFDDAIGPKPRLFVFLTSAWHAERTACKSSWISTAPRYAFSAGTVVFKGVCNEGMTLLVRQWLSNTAFYRSFVGPHVEKLTRDDVELYIETVLAAVRLGRAKYHVPTVIPYIRVGSDFLRATGFDDDEIIRRLQDGGAFVVDASLEKEEADGAAIRIPSDGHPTPFAHRARAALVKSYIEDHGTTIPP